MKTILVPTDFSTAAGNAAEYAVQLAKEIKAKVLLFHVYHVPVPASEVSVMAINPDQLQKEKIALLEKEAAHFKKRSGVEVKYEAKMGFAVDEILMEEKNADLIVMGMKGAGKLTEALIGSVTTSTLRKTKIPVLVIPENAKYKKPEKVVFACDYDPKTDANTFNTLTDFVKKFDAKIYVVNIKQKNEMVAEEKIKEIQSVNKKADMEYLYYFPENENLVEGINEFVKDYQIDMIAIIPHRYSLLERLFHISASKKMAFHTHVPLLALPDNHKKIPAYFL